MIHSIGQLQSQLNQSRIWNFPQKNRHLFSQVQQSADRIYRATVGVFRQIGLYLQSVAKGIFKFPTGSSRPFPEQGGDAFNGEICSRQDLDPRLVPDGERALSSELPIAHSNRDVGTQVAVEWVSTAAPLPAPSTRDVGTQVTHESGEKSWLVRRMTEDQLLEMLFSKYKSSADAFAQNKIRVRDVMHEHAEFARAVQSGECCGDEMIEAQLQLQATCSGILGEIRPLSRHSAEVATCESIVQQSNELVGRELARARDLQRLSNTSALEKICRWMGDFRVQVLSLSDEDEIPW